MLRALHFFSLFNAKTFPNRSVRTVGEDAEEDIPFRGRMEILFLEPSFTVLKWGNEADEKPLLEAYG